MSKSAGYDNSGDPDITDAELSSMKEKRVGHSEGDARCAVSSV